jgi:CheY-like chemotaxis protein
MTTVLLLEDDPGVRHLVTHLLTRRGWTVVAADTLALAQAHLLRTPIDVIVAELESCSHKRYSWRCIEQLHQSAPGAPIILCTIYHEAARDPGRPDGVKIIITKPFRPQTLMAATERLLPPVSATS